MPARKPAAKKPDLYIANQSFSTMVDGEIIGVDKGDLVAPGHKILKGRMNFFDPAEPEDYVKFGLERATAAPGEKRD
jgi:hypothetical protein